jgi:hydroxymethylbilane synthase
MENIIRIGSRASRLAIIQSQQIMAQIHAIAPELQLELVTMTTTGDRVLDKTLDQIGGKGLFLKELDEALMAHRVDLCVHSLKDVPVEENPALPLGAFSKREYPADVLVLPLGKTTLDPKLPVGCASARRTLQFQKLYPHLTLQPVRGNVLTRLGKLDGGAYSALILAEAGLMRLGLSHRISRRFSPEEMVPAAGQGVLAVQSRAGEYTGLLAQLNDPEAALCARTERHLSQQLEGDCTAPIGCYATYHGHTLSLRGFYGTPQIARSGQITGAAEDAMLLAEQLAQNLKSPHADSVYATEWRIHL